MDHVSFPQWVRSFWEGTHCHLRVSRWFHHKICLAVRMARPFLLVAPANLVIRDHPDDETTVSAGSSRILHSTITTNPLNTTCELICNLATAGHITQENILKALPTILDARDYIYSIQQLSEQDLSKWVELLDQVCRPAAAFAPMARNLILLQIIDSRVYPEELRKKTLYFLCETCTERMVLPKSHYFHGKLRKTSGHPISVGGMSDIWRVEGEFERVYALKAYRV
jgi:hypothetical protein